MGYEQMRSKFKFFLYHSILPYVGLFLVKILSSTYRLRIVDPRIERDYVEKDGSIIYASWHQRFFPGITSLQHANQLQSSLARAMMVNSYPMSSISLDGMQ
jgi:lysophospholipid acyltransferase (LPLAT)-like uncharacterized protein